MIRFLKKSYKKMINNYDFKLHKILFYTADLF